MRLQYADRSFDIAFTPDHRDWALAVIADMRRAHMTTTADPFRFERIFSRSMIQIGSARV
jgi:hypothetical protein